MRQRLVAGAAALALAGAANCLHAAAPAAAPASEPASAASAASGPSAIPFKRDQEGAEVSLSRTALALLICLAAGGAAIYLLRGRLTSTSPLKASRRLQVIETRRIGPKANLVLVRWDSEDLLLAQGENGTTLLARTSGVAAGDSAGTQQTGQP